MPKPVESPSNDGDYITKAVFDETVAALETRIAMLETWQGPVDQELTACANRLTDVELTMATRADLDGVGTRLDATALDVAELAALLDGFSFATGDVAAYEAQSGGNARQIFVVVDTLANLAALKTSVQPASGSDQIYYAMLVSA